MRIIHYDMTLSKPYHIGCNPDIHNFGNIQDAETTKWPGIRMIVEDCDDIERFFASFEYVCVDNVHPKFERQITQVLHGDLSEWKLSTVDVDHRELHLGFRNEVLFDKYSCKCQDVETWNKANPRCYKRFPPLPFYSESAISREPDVGAKLRFELDNPMGGGTEVTIVSFCRESENYVIEFDGNKGRRFTFKCGRHPVNQYPVKVQEWMI